MVEDKKEQTVEETKKSPVLLIVIIGMLVLFGAGGFIAWKKYFQIPEKKEEKKGDKKEDKIGPMYSLKPFIVNLADKDSQKYLKLTIQIEMGNQPKLLKELNMRKPQLRDIIIGLLTMQTASDVASFKGKAFIRKEIINRINNVLSTGTINRVFFTEFVLQ